MLLVPVEHNLLLKLLGFCFLFELFRIVLASFFDGPSPEIAKLQAEKAQLVKEISLIKSVLVDFVKHSKLSRQIIAKTKEIDTLKASQAPLQKKIREKLRLVRMICYTCVGLYFNRRSLLLVDPVVILSFFFLFIAIAILFGLFCLLGALAFVLVYFSCLDTCSFSRSTVHIWHYVAPFISFFSSSLWFRFFYSIENNLRHLQFQH